MKTALAFSRKRPSNAGSIETYKSRRQGRPVPASLSGETPLFYVLEGLVKILDKDLKAAGISKIDAPFLSIHSPDDELVPYELGRALFDAAADPKTHLKTADGHNDGGFFIREEWRAEVEKFTFSAL